MRHLRLCVRPGFQLCWHLRRRRRDRPHCHLRVLDQPVPPSPTVCHLPVLLRFCQCLLCYLWLRRHHHHCHLHGLHRRQHCRHPGRRLRCRQHPVCWLRQLCI